MLRWLLVTSMLVTLTSAQFSPGCSFSNGQCLYNVQLGHLGQCDQQIATTTSGQCCESLQGQVAELTSDVATLKEQVSRLLNELQSAKTNVTVSHLELSEAEDRTQALLEALAQNQKELNSSQHEFSQTIQQAGDEIRTLRSTVARLTSDLNTCKGVLGMTSGTATMPPIGTVLPSEVTLSFCDFETRSSNGTCVGLSPGVVRFVRAQGGWSSFTGPQEDRTYGAASGHYALMNTTSIGNNRANGFVASDVAELTSQVYPPAASGYCIRFWYNMYGKDVQVLNVYAKIQSGLGYPIFSRTGSQGQSWHLGEASLDSEYTSSPFSLVFRANTSAYFYYSSALGKVVSNSEGSIAIDDIYVYNTSCSNIPRCPPASVTRVNGSVMYCYTFHVQAVSWYDAAYTCRTEGASVSLVTVKSRDEQDFLVQTIKNSAALSLTGQSGFYTGGNDERSEGTFDWTDTGTPYQTAYSDWKTGQPNNVANNQNCLLLQYPELDFQWGDVDCAEKHPFICETQFPTLPGSGATSSVGLVG